VNGRFTSQEVIATPSDPRTAIQILIAHIRRLLSSCGEEKVEGIGISLPGRVERGSERLVFAPNLNWPQFDIRTPVEQATGLDVELENAANACVLAAIWFDRVDTRNLVVVTVSEGIGTGILVNGRLARGLSGMAGEFGHVPLDPKGPACGCGSRGCWEVFASNRAALRYYFESSAASGGLSFPDLLSLADQGDSRATQALETMAHYLGRGMRMIVAGLDPERILVIGDLTRSWQRFGPIIEAEVLAQVLPGGVAPPVIPVHEGGLARLRGTVALVLQKHFGAGSEVSV
jgi:predicted NBD/HSP70 family sugar kinase